MTTAIREDKTDRNERRTSISSEENDKPIDQPVNQINLEMMKRLIDDEAKKDEDELTINNHITPTARKELNNFISKIKIVNSLHRTSKDTTDGTKTKYEYINDFPTADIKHIPKHTISTPPNNTTTNSQNINTEHNTNHKSHIICTHHNITTIDTKNNTTIQKQNNIKYSESYSSVSKSTESDISINNLQRKRKRINV